MSASNPRKFAEKIAKLQQKEQEQTMAFEQIMAEVIGATRGSSSQGGNGYNESENLLKIINTNQRAESMPNVNQLSSSPASSGTIDLKSALNNLEEIKSGRSPTRDRRHVSPNGLLNPSRPIHGQHSRSSNLNEHHSSHHHGNHHGYHRRISPSSSPYSTPYLSPPDTWRRTNSDSALHQSSIMADRNGDTSSPSLNQNPSPSSSPFDQHNHMSTPGGRRTPGSGGHLGSSSLTNISNACDSTALSTSESWVTDKNDHPTPDYQLLSPASIMDMRPKSCDVPGIAIYPSQEEVAASGGGDGSHHMSVVGNTGSLPDLSSFSIPAPLSTPIDLEDMASSGTVPGGNNMSNGSYGMNPGSPYGGRVQPQSPYSVNSNPNSPFSPQSPLSAMGYSPPTPEANFYDHMVGSDSSPGNQSTSNNGGNNVQQVGHSFNGHSHTMGPRITVEGLAMDTSALSLNNNHYTDSSLSFDPSGDACTAEQIHKFILSSSSSSTSHRGNSFGANNHNGLSSVDNCNQTPPSPTNFAQYMNHNHISPINSPGQTIQPVTTMHDASRSMEGSMAGAHTSDLPYHNMVHTTYSQMDKPHSVHQVQHNTGYSTSPSSSNTGNSGFFMNSIPTSCSDKILEELADLTDPHGMSPFINYIVGNNTIISSTSPMLSSSPSSSGPVFTTSPHPKPQFNGPGHSMDKDSSQMNGGSGFICRNLPLTSSSGGFMPSSSGSTISPSMYSKSVISTTPTHHSNPTNIPGLMSHTSSSPLMSQLPCRSSPDPPTPNSIPDIILTEPSLSDTNGMLSNEFTKDMVNFDTNDLFSGEFKNIDPIEFDLLQGIEDSQGAEDAIRFE